MLTGLPPFVGSLEELAEAHLSRVPPELTDFGGLGGIIAQLLEKDPANRFSSAAELAMALRSVELEPGTPTPLNPPMLLLLPSVSEELVAPPSKKHGPLLLLAPLLAGLVLIAVLWSLLPPAEAPTEITMLSPVVLVATPTGASSSGPTSVRAESPEKHAAPSSHTKNARAHERARTPRADVPTSTAVPIPHERISQRLLELSERIRAARGVLSKQRLAQLEDRYFELRERARASDDPERIEGLDAEIAEVLESLSPAR
jgi:hypothetical protein